MARGWIEAMQSPHRRLQIALGVLVALHLVALAAPGTLWGMSHLAVWPLWAAIAWTAAALAGLALAPRWLGAQHLSFPSRRGSLIAALAAGVLATLLHERSHFFGDSNLLTRSLVHGPVTYWRAPLLVRPATWMAITAYRQFGWSPGTTLTVLSILAGIASTYAALRLIAALTPRAEARLLFAALLATSGAVQLFCGHVEFYAGLSLALVLWTWLAVATLAAQRPSWPTWFATAVLPTLHLSATCLLPAQGVLALAGWRRRERWTAIVTAAAAAALAVAILYAFGRDPRRREQAAASRIIGAFLDHSDIRHAFSLWSSAHALAVLNQWLLVAPIALIALLLALLRRGKGMVTDLGRGTVQFLIVAAVGAVLLDLVFARELGPYRDWDTLAPYALFYLLAAGVLLLRAGFEARIAAILITIAGLHHTVPWLLMSTSPERAERHVQLVLAVESQWSPYARGYLHEEIAIARRDAGDLPSARREYEAAIAANPSDARYRVGAGDMAHRLGDSKAAVAHYAAALERRPDFGPAHNNLAFALMTMGIEPERAREHALAATRGDPSNLNYQLTLGFVELQRRDLPAARRALDAARSLQPNSPKVKDLAEAVALFAAAARDSGTSRTPAP